MSCGREHSQAEREIANHAVGNLRSTLDQMETCVMRHASSGPSCHQALLALAMQRNGDVPDAQRTPRQLFQALAHGAGDGGLTVLAAAGERLRVPTRGGDLLIRAALGEPALAHVAVLVDGRLWDRDELVAAGFQPESGEPGVYTHVIDGGAFRHTRLAHFARRVCGPSGVVLPGQMLVRSAAFDEPPSVIGDAEDVGDTEDKGAAEYGEILERVRRELLMRFDDPNDPGLHERRLRLRSLFASVPKARARELHARLGEKATNDELSRLFHGRLATATRRELRKILEGRFEAVPAPRPQPTQTRKVSCRRENAMTALVPWERSFLALVNDRDEADFKAMTIWLGPTFLPSFHTVFHRTIVAAALKQDSAITIGNEVWFPRKFDTSDVPSSESDFSDLTWLVHESVHVLEYEMAGVEVFLQTYLQQGAVHGFVHDDIPHEQRANRVELRAKRLLLRASDLASAIKSCDGDAILALLKSRRDEYRNILNELMSSEEDGEEQAQEEELDDGLSAPLEDERKASDEAPISPSQVSPTLIPNKDKDEESLAVEIYEAEIAALDAWHSALGQFDKVMESATDAEGVPAFSTALYKHVGEKLLDTIAAPSKLVSGAKGGIDALVEEYERADKAVESAKLRDFIIRFSRLLNEAKMARSGAKADFFLSVRRRAEKMSKKERRAYHKRLVEYADRLDQMRADGLLSGVTLFRLIAFEWVRSTKVRIVRSVSEESFVLIRVNKDDDIQETTIFAPGGAKIAEQLTRDAQDAGLRPYEWPVRRRLLFHGKSKTYDEARAHLTADGTPEGGHGSYIDNTSVADRRLKRLLAKSPVTSTFEGGTLE